ncbi:MAG: hypothetical protein K0Q95_408 [Bacteroidota bacterium]|jgi:hypothetical protein|nr:hypothetical protein [Bacteroidota bacterium]
MKNLMKILLINLVITGNYAHAQDTIIKMNNTIIVAKVIEVSSGSIRYISPQDVSGPTYIVNKDEIAKIIYKNGATDVFNTAIGSDKKAAETISKTPKYILVLVDGTKLKGTIKSQSTKEIVFIDDNFGEKTVSKEKIKKQTLEYGELPTAFTLRDGTIINGQILNKNGTEYVVETKELGTITIPASKIKSIRDLNEAIVTNEGKIWFKNPNSTRYLFAPSAFQLKKGEGYYQNIYGAGNAVNYGLSDHLTIGGGLLGPVGVYVNTKLGFKIHDMVHIGVGAIAGNALFPVNGNNLGVGLGFGVLTLGNYDHNITLGGGYGFINSGGTTGAMEKPVFVANGMARVGKKFALVSENWIINVNGPGLFKNDEHKGSHYDTFFSYAFRYMGENSTLDAGFLNTPALIKEGWYVGIPYIGFVIRFGDYKDQ